MADDQAIGEKKCGNDQNEKSVSQRAKTSICLTSGVDMVSTLMQHAADLADLGRHCGCHHHAPSSASRNELPLNNMELRSPSAASLAQGRSPCPPAPISR